MKKLNKNSLNYKVNDNFEKALIFIRASKNYVYATILIFILSTIFGFIFSSKLSFLDQVLRDIIDKTVNLNGFELIIYIFNNNVGVAFFSLVLGIFIGIIPIFYGISNGVILGYVFSKLYNISKLSEFWRILPHGIFELPAIIISLALGLKLGIPFIFRYFNFYWKKRNFLAIVFFFVFPIISIIFTLIINSKMRKYQLDDLNSRFTNSFRVFIFVVVPLLIIAAIIEGLLIALLK